jgi:dihydrofolate synthase/folylpolyglutamate synthase
MGSSPRHQRAEEILGRLELFGIRMGLDTTRPLLRALGDPQRRVPTVLVAGTNGKGSTATLIAAIAHAAGYRVGLYTSPHLEAVEERLRIDGRAIDGARLGELLEAVIAGGETALEAPPTYFEALTAAAWLWFAESRVDLAVMEVGMGGRLDATNAGDPLLSVITSIGLDHTHYLGETLAAIAREKAGILRRGVPALAWPGSAEAAAAIRAAAAEIGAPLTLAPDATRIVARADGCAGQRVTLATRAAEDEGARPGERHYQIDLRLAGRHQAENLALAVLAAERLAAIGFDRIDAAAIAAGAGGCRWPGRLEHVRCPPPFDGRELLLDAAHYPAGIAALVRFLTEEPAIKDRPYDLLFGAFANKEVADMLPAVARRARRVVLTSPQGRSAYSPEQLAEVLAGQLADRPAGSPTPVLDAQAASAFDTALPGDGLLVVCGSLYLVGEVRALARRRMGVPVSPLGSIFGSACDEPRPVAAR